MALVIRIEQNYKLISEKSLVSLAVSRYDADTVGFVQTKSETLQSSEGYERILLCLRHIGTRPDRQGISPGLAYSFVLS